MNEKQIQRIIGIAVGVALLIMPIIAGAAAPTGDESPPQAVFERLRQEAGGDLEVYWDAETGVPAFLAGQIPDVGLAGLQPEAAARAFFARYAGLYRMQDPQTELALERVTHDEIGMDHVRFTQQVNGVPVHGGELIVHLREGRITAVNGHYYPGLAVDTAPKLRLGIAAAAVRAHLQLPTAGLSRDQSRLIVYRLDDQVHLTWRVILPNSPTTCISKPMIAPSFPTTTSTPRSRTAVGTRCQAPS